MIYIVHQCPLPEIKNEPSETNKSKYQIKLFIVFKQKQYKSRHPSSTSIVLGLGGRKEGPFQSIQYFYLQLGCALDSSLQAGRHSLGSSLWAFHWQVFDFQSSFCILVYRYFSDYSSLNSSLHSTSHWLYSLDSKGAGCVDSRLQAFHWLVFGFQSTQFSGQSTDP